MRRDDELWEEGFLDRLQGSAGPVLIGRREFLKLTATGIVIWIAAGEDKATAGEPRRGGRGGEFRRGAEGPQDFNAFLRIGEDGRVTGFTGKIEMGQGTNTALTQMLAEELDVPFSSVTMVLGDTDLCPFDGGTNGSRSIKYFGPMLLDAAAEAREVLIDLAAEELKVARDRLVARQGSVVDREDPAKGIAYAALAKGKRIERRLTGKAKRKDAAAFTVSGRPIPRIDGVDKVTGKARFSADIRLPGLLHAAVLRPPAHGAKLKSVDTAEAEKVEGARVVRDGDLVAVLHALPDVAAAALARVKAQWDVPRAEVNDRTIHEHLAKASSGGNGVEPPKGDIEVGRRAAVKVFEETYRDPYVAHAPMEPHAAVVSVEGNRATAWVSTQRPFGTRDEIAQALGFDRSNVRLIAPFVGGGFGGKSRNVQAGEAARLSKLTGKPVQVAYTREEEFFYDAFRPASFVTIASGLDAGNRIIFWDYHVHFAGNRSSECIYDVPNVRTTAHGGGFGGDPVHPFATGAWRAPGSNSNVFARESHIDVMAAAARIDPVEFRLTHIREPRLKKVLEEAARAFGWQRAPCPSGKGRGAACADYLGTQVAAVAEVEVDRASGAVRVVRIVCAQDMGRIINPENGKMQIEGCLTMGLGYALTEELRFEGGAIRDRNFDTYDIPRFSWAPKIQALLVESDVPSQGCGEPAIILSGAVLANAVFDATGARFTRLPMTPERVKEAIAAAGKR